MAPVSNKRRRGEEEVRRPKKKIRVKKQAKYHSSSEDDDDVDVDTAEKTQRLQGVVPKSIMKQSIPRKQSNAPSREEAGSEVEDLDDLDEAERNTALNIADAVDDEGSESDDEHDEIAKDDVIQSDADEDESDEDEGTPSEISMNSGQASAAKQKRNDPNAFATSISKILDTKLSTAKRSDPVLSRSKAAAEANKNLADTKLDVAARAQIRAERKQALQKGRVTDLLGLGDAGVDTGRVLEEEKRLKKIAQRGVVKLFNAVRAAQVGAEKAAKEESGIGRKQKEERVSEMSKEGFLEMISRGRDTATT